MKKSQLARLFIAPLLLMGACAAADTKDIKIESDVDPKADLKGYQSYAWLRAATIVQDPAGKWEPPQFDADAEIKFLIDRELRKRGISEDSVDPDMLVVFAAGIDMDNLRMTVDPESKIRSLQNIPQGALLVALVDAETDVAVWAARATANIQQEPSTETVKKRLDYAVTSMFKKLPR
jgi:hypothetical protein